MNGRRHIQIASLSIATKVGKIVGLGLVFPVPEEADTSFSEEGTYRSTKVAFVKNHENLHVVIEIAHSEQSVVIEVSDVEDAVLNDLMQALKVQRYYYIVACIGDTKGGLELYRPESHIIIGSEILVNKQIHQGLKDGLWTPQSNPFL